MSKKTVVAAAFALIAVAAAFFAGARKAQAQAPAEKSPMSLLWEDRDTSVYFLQHEGHNCFVATTRGGAGITISCPK